jgi:hypothetical protein
LFLLEKWLVALRNRRWGVALLAIWLLYVTVVGGLGVWKYVGVPGLSPIFADWHAVLSAADCHKLGHNVFVENPCDNWARTHVYGSLWLQLGKLGLGVRDVFWLGLVINAAFMVLVVVLLINPSTLGELLIGATILLSPAIMLAIERANNDLIIFGLLVLAALLVAGQYRHGQIGGLLVTSLSVFLKFYPAALFGVIALIARSRKEFLVAVIGGISLLAVWLYLSADELVLLRRVVPRPDGPFATGSTLLFKYICPTCEIVRISLAVAAVALAVAFFLSRKMSVEPLSPGVSRQCCVLFCFGLTVLLSTFLVNSNFDYRWIFFLLLVPMLFEIRRQPQANKLAKKLVALIIGFTLLVMWCEAFVLDVPGAFKIIRKPLSLAQIESVQRCLWIVKQAAAWLSLTFATAIAVRALIESQQNDPNGAGKMRSRGRNAYVALDRSING